MIEGQDILYFSADDWGCGLSTSQTHLARILSKKNRILYINSLGLRKPKVNKSDMKRMVSKFSRFTKGIEQAAENIWIFTPIVIPFHDSDLYQAINKKLLVSYINFYLKKLKMKNPIFWSYLPNTVNLVGKFNESRVIYYCVDEYIAFDGVPKAAIQKQEEELIRKADFIFTTSTGLYESKRIYNPAKTFHSPHGVDITHFKQALDANLPVPEDVRHIPHPIIGFYGLIDNWVNLELIAKAAEARPDWSFLLIGNVKTDITRLNALKNIHFLGRKPYEELPRYNKIFDVALLPYILNELTKNMNHIKLREYLAAGTPIVATRSPEVVQFQDVLYVVDEAADFIEKIELALKEKGPIPYQQRMQFIEHESWENRVEKISEIIMQGGK
ncbi:glycosyltransferase [candidate division KSB1 bacterium]|nr:glycosyltransferase [candidate division KSB1 bacterium]